MHEEGTSTPPPTPGYGGIGTPVFRAGLVWERGTLSAPAPPRAFVQVVCGLCMGLGSKGLLLGYKGGSFE